MPSIQETAYPRLKSSPTPKDLDKLFSPTSEEITWVKTRARHSFSQLGLIIMLKTFQCLNYFVPISDVPQVIIKHIAKVSILDLPDLETWESYHRSGTGIRQIAMIREYRKVKVFDEQARQVMMTAMENSVLEKDAKSDIINVAIDELVKNSYELPSFSTLVKAVDHIHAVAYRTLYKLVSDALSNKEKEILDALFQSKEESTYTDWNMIKQDPGRPTLGQLKEWISRKNWISERNVGTDFFQRLRIPSAKINRLADEAMTLDAAGMKKVEPYKRYTLAVALLFSQFAKTIDDIGEMYTKRVAIAENKAERSLNDLKEKKEKQTDALISTLRDTVVAFQTDGTAEQRLKALEKMIGGNRGQHILENCETHLAYTGNNYFSFMWKHLKSNRSELIKMLESLELKSTTQNKGLEQAISFLLENKNKKSEWIPITLLNKKGDNQDDWEWIPLVDLSWVPEGWWRWISPNRRRSIYPKKINRRHFEICVFYQIRNELKSGDLCIEGSEKYGDYRKQLVSWEEYQENVHTFCEQAGLPTNAQAFKEQVYK